MSASPATHFSTQFSVHLTQNPTAITPYIHQSEAAMSAPPATQVPPSSLFTSQGHIVYRLRQHHSLLSLLKRSLAGGCTAACGSFPDASCCSQALLDRTAVLAPASPALAAAAPVDAVAAVPALAPEL